LQGVQLVQINSQKLIDLPCRFITLTKNPQGFFPWKHPLKMKNSLRKPLPLLVALLLPGSFLQAGNVWDGGGSSGSWSDLNNWDSNTTPVSPTALTFGGTSQLTNTNDLFAAGTAFNGIGFNAGSGAFVIGGNSILLNGSILNNSTSTQTLNMDLSVTAVRTVTLTTGGGDLVLGGNISGAGGLSVNGFGTIRLSGTNTYAGDTTISNTSSGVTLIVGNKDALGTGVLRLNAGTTIQAASNLSGVNKIANEVVTTHTVIASGSNSIEFGGDLSLNNTGSRALTNNISSGTLTLNDVFLNLDTTAGRVLTLDGTGTTVVKGVIANGGASHLLGIGGTATVTLESANTYTGGTNLGGTATVILGNKASLGTGNLNVTGNTTIQASTDLTGANKIANNILSTAPGGPTFSGSHSVEVGGKLSMSATGDRSVTNNLTSGSELILNNVDINLAAGARALIIAGTGDTRINGVIADGSANANKLTITNTGVTTLAGSSTYTGATAVNAGMLVFGNTATKASGTVTAGASGSIGLGVGGSGYYSSANVDSLFANTLSGFTMNAASGVGIDTSAGDFTYATNQSAARSLTKLGANKLILSGTNTYSGATVVKAGSLIVNGSVAGSGVTVQRGGTLGGSGTVSSQVTVKSGGTLSPGNSPGVATYSGGLSLETGSAFTFELIADSTSNRGTDFDGVNVTGGVFNLQSGVIFNLTLNGAGSSTDYASAFWDSNQNWLVFDIANTPTIAALFTLGSVSNDSLGNAFSTTGGSFGFNQVGNDIYLVYTAVPEPSTWVLLAGGLTCMLILRRRRH
jgi:fibronectin-binding autotransporter adhesin